jgi:hypothetical protein
MADSPPDALTIDLSPSPKNTRGGAVGFLCHDLRHQSIEVGDAVSRFTATVNLRAPHIPSGQVGQSTAAAYSCSSFMGHRGGRLRRMQPLARLDAGFLFRRNDAIVRAERLALPQPGIQVRDASGLVFEGRIAGENLAAIEAAADPRMN